MGFMKLCAITIETIFLFFCICKIVITLITGVNLKINYSNSFDLGKLQNGVEEFQNYG